MLTPSTGISLRSPARWSRLGTDQRRARRRAATCRATPVGDPRSKEDRRGRRNRQHPRRGRRFEVSTQVHSGVGQGGRRPASLPPPRADHPNGGIPQPRRGCPLMLKNQVRELVCEESSPFGPVWRSAAVSRRRLRSSAASARPHPDQQRGREVRSHYAAGGQSQGCMPA